MNMIYLCKWRHRRKFFKIFENSFLKKGILEFLSEALKIAIWIYSSKDNEIPDQNVIYPKIVITSFRKEFKKCTKILIYFRLQNLDDERCFQKAYKLPIMNW